MKKVIRFTLLAAASFILPTVVAQAQTTAAPALPAGEPDQAAFQHFLQQFPKAQLPYVIGTTELSAQLEQRAQGVQPARAAFLPWECYDFLPDLERSAMATNMPAHPQPIAAFESAEYHAVLYNVGRATAKQYRALYVAVFDKQGRHLATTFVAGVNPNALVSAVIDENLHVNVLEHRVEWAKNPKEGIVGNRLTGLAPLASENFDLTAVATDTHWNDRHEPKSSAAGAMVRNDSK